MVLPQSKKDKWLPLLLLRDGKDCLYCKQPLTVDDLDYDHLDNDDTHNEFVNFGLVHHKCNCEKRNSPEFQIIAKEKLDENKKTIPLYMGGRKNLLVDPEERQEQSLEMKVRTDTYNITKQWLDEHINIDGEIEYKDAIDSIAYYSMEKTGHGSPKVIRSHIDALCSSIGRFMVVKDSETRKKKIVKRNDI